MPQDQCIVFKWDPTPTGVYKHSFIETKLYSIDTSTNKFSVINFVVNTLVSANSAYTMTCYYRFNSGDGWSLMGTETKDKETSSTNHELTFIQGMNLFLTGGNVIEDATGIQFKLSLFTKGTVAINDMHFLIRKKRNYSVTEEANE